MTLTLEMSGYDRTYLPPRGLRGQVLEGDRAISTDHVTAWDLLNLTSSDKVGSWASSTLDSVMASIDGELADKRGCSDCRDTGFYGVADAENPDLLIGLMRRVGSEDYEQLAADGHWQPALAASVETVEILSLEMAGDLADAILTGHSGLLRKYAVPRAFLPPAEVVSATPAAELLSVVAASNPQSEWVNFAAVDDDDPGAVWALVRASGSATETLVGDTWVAGPVPEDWHLVELDQLTADALLADAPLTVSPDPRAERLRRYWSRGPGAAKIRWGTPSDWKRCYRQLRKYMGLRAKGYCQNMHKRNTGVWTGDRRNAGRRGSASIEENLLAAIQAGEMTAEGQTTVTDTDTLVMDGEYAEIVDNVELLRSLVAGAFPTAPPDDWFTSPNLTGPTPLTVEDDGRVYGHIATFDVAHIGLPGKTNAPRSGSNYAYFRTGDLVTASGQHVPVGQLTLAGGHASMRATAEQAVKHYDDTGSAIADVAAGEDRYGIWVAGGLRPTVTPEQLRVLRASAPSGDWRTINGRLELVAVCQVNVPGFPVARALAAGGAIQTLVAAGARPLALQRATIIADAVLLDRVTELERIVGELPTVAAVEAAPVTDDARVTPTPDATPVPDPEPAPETAPAADPATDPEPADNPAEGTQDPNSAEETEPAQPQEETVREPEEPVVEDKLAQARARIAAVKQELELELLRNRVHGDAVAAAGFNGKKAPPFIKKDSPDAPKGKGERKGIGGFPINNVEQLKDAISAFGRAKPEDRAATKAHIISAAKKLKRTDLIPEKWLASSSK